LKSFFLFYYFKLKNKTGNSGGFLGANVPIATGRPQAAVPGRPQTASQPSAPAGPIIEIISYENVNNGDGSYKWRY
jgi:hypothetical protein